LSFRNNPLEIKKEAWKRIEDQKSDLINLCSDIIKIPSDNPPGNTIELASFIKKILQEKGLKVKTYEPKKGCPNLVSTIKGSRNNGPHLILNGHLDQFPADVGEPWDIGPYSGEIKEGKIYGRGAGDMKGGVSALTFLFCLLKEMNLDLPGKVTLTLVSDEETGGKWGAYWLLENVPELIGDACLNAEPSGLTVRIGEKGFDRLKLTSVGKPAHGSFAGYVGDNAIMKMIKILPPIENLNNIKGRFNKETERVIEEGSEGYRVSYGLEIPNMAEILKHVTVNIGVIKGGSKVNIVPGVCEVELDIRLPIGISHKEIEDEIKRIIKEEKNITLEHLADPSIMLQASYTSLEEKIYKSLLKNIKQVIGEDPLISFTSAATDCGHFRSRKIPSLIYGPQAFNMAAANEHIRIEDLIKVTKVHIGTVIDYFLSK
jgi:succinyl-diaminopimelate desuccinylase